MKKLTAEWVKKAEADFVAAGRLAKSRAPLHDLVCFHAQQAAEKYLKALLEELGLTIPHTHNLVALLTSLSPHHGSLRSLRRGLDFLTRFAVDTRYPGDSASKRQATAALRWARRVRGACRSLLGIKPRRRKK
jgi:HEPN domain-containing protein